MKWLTLLALAAATPAIGAPYTLNEVAAMAPDQRSFTGSPLVELTGLPSGVGSLDPVAHEERGGGYDILDVGNVSLVAGDWTIETLSGDHILATKNEFVGQHGNDYDFVALFVAQPVDFRAFYSPLQNDVSGIGLEVFDQTTDLGFGQLQGFLFMGNIFDYEGSIRDALFFGQEVGHRWSSYVRRPDGGRDMLGRDDAHWSFFLESQNSTMEGNAWVEVGDGQFETDHLAEIGYSELDEYLMGLRAPEDVSDWFLIEDPEITSNPRGWPTESDAPPYYAIRAQLTEQEAEELGPIEVTGERIDISIDEVIEENGARLPAAQDSQRAFSMAFVIMMPASEPVTFDDYLVVEDVAEDLVALWEGLVDGKATLSNELGASGLYDFVPAVFAPAPVFEPGFDPTTDTGLLGTGCQSSQAGGAGARAWAMACVLLGLVLRRRRPSTSFWP